MFKKKQTLPLEGDLLFEKKSNVRELGTVIPILTIAFLIYYLTEVLQKGISDIPILIHLLLLCFLLEIIHIVLVVIMGFKSGFDDETYTGYFFHDKIVFYRISRYVSSRLTEGKTKEELLIEISQISTQIEIIEKSTPKKDLHELELYVFNSKKELALMPLKARYHQLQDCLAIAENPDQPHKTELYFQEVKYFINETKDEIKLVTLSQNNENELNLFFNKLKLSNTYKKSKADIISFLNQQVAKEKSKLDISQDN